MLSESTRKRFGTNVDKIPRTETAAEEQNAGYQIGKTSETEERVARLREDHPYLPIGESEKGHGIDEIDGKTGFLDMRYGTRADPSDRPVGGSLLGYAGGEKVEKCEEAAIGNEHYSGCPKGLGWRWAGEAAHPISEPDGVIDVCRAGAEETQGHPAGEPDNETNEAARIKEATGVYPESALISTVRKPRK